MSKKQKPSKSGIVYSTNPDFVYNTPTNPSLAPTLHPDKQNLHLRIEKKGRSGKTATIVGGFVGTVGELKKLSKMLKTKCGVGGSEKDHEIIIQGDLKEKVFTILTEAGYRVKK